MHLEKSSFFRKKQIDIFRNGLCLLPLFLSCFVTLKQELRRSFTYYLSSSIYPLYWSNSNYYTYILADGDCLHNILDKIRTRGLGIVGLTNEVSYLPNFI